MAIELPGCPADSASCASNANVAEVNSILLDSAQKYGGILKEDVGPDLSPYIGFFNRTEWPDGQAKFNSFHWETNAPDVGLDRWASVKSSTDTYNACNVAFDEIPYGWSRKEGCQYRTAFRTPWFCLEDLKYKHDRAEQVAGVLRIMSRWFSIIQQNFIGLTFKRYTDNYIPVDAAASGNNKYAIRHGEFEPGAYPVYGLTPGMLRKFYLDKGYKNAHRLAVGKLGGGIPLHGLMVGDQLWRDCIEADPKFRQAILESDPQLLTNGQSAKQSIEGFTPMYVQYPYRFKVNNATGDLDLVQPLIHEAATSGIKSVVNPEWEAAPFEWVAMPTPDSVVFTDPPMGTSVGQANFDAEQFKATPNVVWHNEKDNDCNILGNQGFWYTLIQMGALPSFTDHGAGVLVRRPNIQDVITCGDFVSYDATEGDFGGPVVYLVTTASEGLDPTKKVIEVPSEIADVVVDTTKLLVAYHTGQTAIVTITAESGTAPWRYEIDVDGDEWPCDCSAIKSVTAYVAPEAFGGFPEDPQVLCECVDKCPATKVQGVHDGSAEAAILTDTSATFTVDALIGQTIHNVTDGSSAVITDNTATTITATLAGGTENDWDVGDAYLIIVG